MVGIGAVVLAAILAVAEAACLYALIVSHMTWHGRLEAAIAVPFLAGCVYLLSRLARTALENRRSPGWQRADAIWLLAVGMIAYGGSIPWAVYLAVTKYPEMWWLSLVCGPFYCYLTWLVLKMFRHRMETIEKARGSNQPLSGTAIR